MKKVGMILVSLLLILSTMTSFSLASSTEDHDAELWNVVKPLGTTITFLNTGAHPDDERSDLLAYLSRGLGVKTSSLIANRGEGGQNEIGTELGNALGIIRSQEMIEAAKITGVKAYHLSETTSDSIYDFGFEKTPEDTLEKWGEEVTYERLIRFIRSYRPDIVMPSFRNVDSQHGHHRTISILSERAFEDAADPSIFPEHFSEGLEPWQIEKFYLPAVSKEISTVSLEIGDYDPIYEMSYPQLGEASRYMHKSQGMGNDIEIVPRQSHLELIKTNVKSSEGTGLFAGIPYNFAEWATEVKDKSLSKKLLKAQESLDATLEAYPNRENVLDESQKSLKQIRKLYEDVKHSSVDDGIKVKLLSKLQTKEQQLEEASFVASSLEVVASLPDNVLSPGEETTATLTIKNNGAAHLKNIDPTILADPEWDISQLGKAKNLKPGETEEVEFKVTVPEDADYYHPYDAPALQASLTFKEKGEEVHHVQKFEGTVAVLPEFSLKATPDNIVVNTKNSQKDIPVTVEVKNYQNQAAEPLVKIEIPEGWVVSDSEKAVKFTEKYETKQVEFILTPPENATEESINLPVTAEWNGKEYNSTIQEIEYEHIGKHYFEYPSMINAVAFELDIPENLKVGYIESGFDNVADALINTGMDIEKLSAETVENGDLSQYDTIVLGIRAYLSRDDLFNNNERLLQYVEDGGHLVVQYHKPGDRWDIKNSAPYDLELGSPSIRWRVTDENAEVTVTKPESTLFSFPNQIDKTDWDGWVQERGLYYPMNWASNYETFVSMADPNEDAFEGGILMADYGEGTYLYTNLVFYRQIQDQVPGGYRILTNLISHGANN